MLPINFKRLDVPQMNITGIMSTWSVPNVQLDSIGQIVDNLVQVVQKVFLMMI